MAEEKEVKEVVAEKNEIKNKKKKGIWSRLWQGLFRLHGDDFEKRLQYISKEEATILARMKRRSLSWRKSARNIIMFSVILEVVAVGYAIITTRSVLLNWKMRALRVLPMFLLPVLSAALYSTLLSITRMCDRRDQRTLERLRAERQAKIDELKERTNYYTTQQLIQRYDTDPAAKAAAATILASKLGADSGLKVFVGDESHLNPQAAGKSYDVEPVQSSGLRKRNQSDFRSKENNVAHYPDNEMSQHTGDEVPESFPQSPVVVEHHNPASFSAQEGGWVARVAALLVGEDPRQSYALICGNCHMHNGLAMKEDFPFITYYCPHCHALNKPRNSGDRTTCPNTPNVGSPTGVAADVNLIKQSSGTISEKVSRSTSPVANAVDERDGASEKIVAEDPASH